MKVGRPLKYGHIPCKKICISISRKYYKKLRKNKSGHINEILKGEFG